MGKRERERDSFTKRCKPFFMLECNVIRRAKSKKDGLGIEAHKHSFVFPLSLCVVVDGSDWIIRDFFIFFWNDNPELDVFMLLLFCKWMLRNLPKSNFVSKRISFFSFLVGFLARRSAQFLYTSTNFYLERISKLLFGSIFTHH